MGSLLMLQRHHGSTAVGEPRGPSLREGWRGGMWEGPTWPAAGDRTRCSGGWGRPSRPGTGPPTECMTGVACLAPCNLLYTHTHAHAHTHTHAPTCGIYRTKKAPQTAKPKGRGLGRTARRRPTALDACRRRRACIVTARARAAVTGRVVGGPDGFGGLAAYPAAASGSGRAGRVRTRVAARSTAHQGRLRKEEEECYRVKTCPSATQSATGPNQAHGV